MAFVRRDASASVFLGPNWRIILKQNGEDAILMDVGVAAFALHPTQPLIATLTKPDENPNEVPKKKKGNAPKPGYILRVYTFDRDECEVGDLRGSVVVEQARSVVWSPTANFLFTFDPPSGTIVLIKHEQLAERSNLSVIARDTGLAPLFYPSGADWCGILNDRRQSVDFWSLSTNKVVETLQLSRRGVQVVDNACAEHLIATVYNDRSLAFAYWCAETKKFVKLQKIDGLFPEEEDNAKVARLATKVRICGSKASTATCQWFVVGLTSSRFVYLFESSSPSNLRLIGRAELERGDSVSSFHVDGSGNGVHVALVEESRLQYVHRVLQFEEAHDDTPKKRERKRREKKSDTDDVDEDEDLRGGDAVDEQTTSPGNRQAPAAVPVVPRGSQGGAMGATSRRNAAPQQQPPWQPPQTKRDGLSSQALAVYVAGAVIAVAAGALIAKRLLK